MHGRQFVLECSMDPIVRGLPVTGSLGTILSSVELSKDSSACMSNSPTEAAVIKDTNGDSDRLGSAGGAGVGSAGRGIASE
jgi:hypothetical protein